MYAISLYMTFNSSMCSTMLRQYTGATFVTRLLSPREMAQQSGWPEGRIRRLISTRRLRHIKIDGLILLSCCRFDGHRERLNQATPA